MCSIFISYSHVDDKQQADLRRFLDPLGRKGLIKFWDDRKIQTGDDWKREIDQALAATSMAVLLVTQNFLNSTFIADEELPYLLAKHKKHEITILPVFLDISNVGLVQPDLAAIQGYGSPLEPLSKLKKLERLEKFKALSERLAELAQRPPPPPPPPPLDRGNYELNVNLRREGAKLMLAYRRPGEDPFLRCECAWAEVEASIRPILNSLRTGAPQQLANELAANAEKSWAWKLFELLFKDKDLATIFRAAFYQFDPAVMPNPVRAPLRLRISSDDPELAALPWRIMAWDGHLLRERRWVFATGQNPDPVNDVSTLASCEVLLIAESGHGEMLKESLLSLWPKADASIRLATCSGEVQNAILGQSPHLVYVHAQGSQGLRLSDGVLPLPKLAEWLNAQRPGPAVVMLYLENCGLSDPRALFGGSIPLLLWRTVTSPMRNPTALPLAWLHAWLGEGRDPVEALQQICREGSPVDAVEALTLAVRANYRHWRTDPPQEGPRNPATLHRLDRDTQKAHVGKWLRELIDSDRMRVMALVPFGTAGNHLEKIHEQLCQYAETDLHDRAKIKQIKLEFPESRADLRVELEHELRQQLQREKTSQKSERELLQCASPCDDPDRRSVLWLHWGVFGGTGNAPLLKLDELNIWLNFICEFVTHHCPEHIRIVCSLALETPDGEHSELRESLDDKDGELTDNHFVLNILEPVGNVEKHELRKFLRENSGCPPQLCVKLADLLSKETGGEFQQLVALIEPAEKTGSWHSLLGQLQSRHKPPF